MVCNQPFHRTFHYPPQGYAQYLCRLGHFVAVNIGDRTNTIHGVRVVIVLHHVATNKGFEGVDQQLVYGRVLAMARKEGTEPGKEPTGEGLAINMVDDVGHAGIVFFEERRLQVAWELIFKYVAHQSFAKVRPATFIAKDET